MKETFPTQPGYRGLMTGLFAGLVATLACLLFNLIYRKETGFLPTEIINIVTLSFAVNLLFPVVGMLYSGLRSFAQQEASFYDPFSPVDRLVGLARGSGAPGQRPGCEPRIPDAAGRGGPDPRPLRRAPVALPIP
ncbi:MAG: hypothetical protein EOO16_00120 [Chitinophagaceae bacterium]|nr:MAG: hypothetical protein EOO16_00120 [Chitinophagaceae bacterium]